MTRRTRDVARVPMPMNPNARRFPLEGWVLLVVLPAGLRVPMA